MMDRSRQQKPRTARTRTGGLVALAVGGVLLTPMIIGAPAAADPASPTPASPTTSPTSATPATSPTAGTPTATDPSTSASNGPSTPAPTPPAPITPAPSSSATSASATSPATQGRTTTSSEAKAKTAAFTLGVSSIGSPKSGAYYQDIGSFGLSGAVSDRAAGQTVEIWRFGDGTKAWYKLTTTKTGADQRYATRYPVTWASAAMKFCATLGGSPAAASTVKACAAPILVSDAKVTLSGAPKTLNALKDPTITGSVSPARAGVKVNLDVKRSDGTYRATTTVTTAKDGTWKAVLTYGHGSLTTHRIRAAYKATNRSRWETSTSRLFQRTAVLDAKIAKTTSADVAKTYRSGCPVGPSKLRTISLNYYGMSDHKMHRGVIIIRSDLADDLIRGFGSALAKRYPIAKMNNPNVYGGNDPRQMEADNTSGFNCRKVTGNPYAQSPHSYGTALDVNTVENPYRDVHGKWWPKNGKKYIDRSPLKAGMLSKNSTLTKSLRKDKFFWGGFWNPGRDYQHFQR